ncbi:hypothetical protein JCM11251_007011 [Rhodosporidiobolus azoricus]
MLSTSALPAHHQLHPYLSLPSLPLAPPHRPSVLQTSYYPELVSSPVWMRQYALLQTLGEPGDGDGGMWGGSGHRVVKEAYGSTGCVNAMDWEDGSQERLATAGDDTKICIWKPGLDRGSDASSTNMQYGLSEVIDTGHRANIFSVKWAPGTETRMFSCAGDATVRVYDLNLATNSALNSSTISPSGGSSSSHQPWTHHEDASACTHVFRCHLDRVKRVATEASSDVFLTCGEDGTVRQHDLRTHHVCRASGLGRQPNASCPPPLASYHGLSLYSLSLSKLRPHLFVVAGTAPYAFLHDRRMLRSAAFRRDWGDSLSSSSSSSANSLTTCVRRFGVPAPKAPHSGDLTNHIVATKLSPANPRELLVSYSDKGVYLFDTDGETYVRPDPPKKEKKRRRSRARYGGALSDEQLDEEEEDGDKDALIGSEVAGEPGTPNAEIEEERFAQAAETPQGRRRMALSRQRAISSREDEIEYQSGPTTYPAEPKPVAPSTVVGRVAVGEEPGLEDDGASAVAVAESEEDAEDSTSAPEEKEDMDESDDELVGTEDDEQDEEEESEEDSPFMPRPRMRVHHPDAPMVAPLKQYTGHANSQTVKDVNYAFNGSMVASGSDDGMLFLWDKDSTEVQGIFKGDSSVVNVVQPHPRFPLLAVSGIDSEVKIFGPTANRELAAKTNLLEQKEEIMGRNARGEGQARFGMNPAAFLSLLASRLGEEGMNALDFASADDPGEGGEEGGRRRVRIAVDPSRAGDCRVM